MTNKETVYTEAVVESMVESYTAAQSDEARASVVTEIAEKLGVKVASVRAKLVNLGVYKAKERVAKNGEPVETKAKIVKDIAELAGVSEEVVESLEKATKPALKMIRDALSK